MKKAHIKIKRLTETAKMPKRGSREAAGYGLYADITLPVSIPPHDDKMIPSGLAMEIESGYCIKIYARSGKAVKEHLRPATCVSIIDADYRGPVGLPIHNDSDKTYIVYPQERICQMCVEEAIEAEFEEVSELSDTERGDGGYGSTGQR